MLTLEKPSVEIYQSPAISQRKDVLVMEPTCTGSPGSFQVQLSGKAPWNVQYIHEHMSAGITETEEKNVSVETHFLQISLDTHAGLHMYILISIADANYGNPIALRTSAKSLYRVEQVVFALPTAIFLDPSERIFHCISKENGSLELNLKLTGHAPFNLEIQEMHNNIKQRKMDLTVEASHLSEFDGGFQFQMKIKPERSMGRYLYVLTKVSDATGCESTYDKDSPQAATAIEIADQAKIFSSNPPNVCVGDILSYSLQGTPPFTVGFTFDGVAQQELTIADPILTLWAGSMGDVVITKICNAMGCCDEHVGNDPSMKSTVRPLPRVIVDGGIDQVDDIREG